MFRRTVPLLALALLSTPLAARAQPVTTTPTTTTTPTVAPEDPTRPPQRCGMTDADVTFGPISVGTVVTLQRHRFVHGDDNWDVAMLRFLGREARITRLSGVDAQGCAGVRVDVDGGTWFWRARDLGLGTDVQPRPAAVASTMHFPQNCGMSDYGGADYGSAVAGASVILGRHRAVNGDTYWASDMDMYVGRRARVLRQAGVDSQGCPCVNVDADGGVYFWRIRDFRDPGGSYDAADLASYVPSAGVTSDHGRPATSGGVGPDPFGGGGMFGTGGVPGPQACGLTDATVDWAGIRTGTRVTLGRHREVDGVDNWDPAMDSYVGLTATVRTLIGVDPQGCPIIYVDVDGGAYFWRVRDVTVSPDAAAPVVSTLPGSWTGLHGGIPSECGQASGSENYGPITVGSRVVLGRHAPYTGPGQYGEMVYDDTDWAYDMESYVGMTATVISLEGADSAGCPGVRVDLDGGSWFWRIRDMTMGR